MMTEKDVELRLRMETDPRMMAELGGPRPREDTERAHAKSLALAAEGKCWPLKVIPDGSTSPAGGVAIFPSSHDGETIWEIGWMILPEFQHPGRRTQPGITQKTAVASSWILPRGQCSHRAWPGARDRRCLRASG